MADTIAIDSHVEDRPDPEAWEYVDITELYVFNRPGVGKTQST